MGSTTLKSLLMATSILATAGLAQAADTTLTIESWRTDDLAIWQEKLIPAFEARILASRSSSPPRRRPNMTLHSVHALMLAALATSLPAAPSTSRWSSSSAAIWQVSQI